MHKYYLSSALHKAWLPSFLGLVLLSILLLTSSLATGQMITGTLTGTVEDQVGAAIPSAKVILTNQATRDVRRSQSNEVGYFTFPGLVPGTYTLTVEVSSFKAWRRGEITINPGDLRNISDIRLQIGNTSETVTVEAVAGEVAPVDSGERSAVVTAKEIERLPVQGRELSELLKVLPGVINSGNNLSSGSGFNFLNMSPVGSAVGNGLSTNGVPNRGGTNLLLDGANIIDPGCNCTSIATVNPDMTQEVKVASTNFGADNPLGPVVVTNISKAGGSEYHGEGYLYARHNVLNANDWADNFTNTPKGPDHYYYPGGNIGGPVPGTHKKMFFWVGYEHYLQNLGNAGKLLSSIPTPDMLMGNFTPTAANLAVCPDGFNSTNTNWCNNLAGTHLPDGTVVPDNGAAGYQIPSQFLDPGAAALAKVFPTKGILTSADAINANGGYNYLGVFPSDHNGYVLRARVDYNFNENNKLFVSYQTGNDSQLEQGTGAHMWWTPGNAIPFPGGGLTTSNYSKTATGHFLHVFGPTMTNEFIAAWGWANSPQTASIKDINRHNLGYPYPTVFPGNATINMIPSFNCGYCGPNQMPDFSQFDIFETGGKFYVRSENPSFADNFTKVYKSHMFKVGGYYARVGKFQGNALYPNGDIASWSGQNPNLITGDTLGSANNRVANFVMGIANQYTEASTSPNNDIAAKTIAVYVDDTWKITRRVTVELGARWEHVGHWFDRAGNGMAVFIPGLVNSDFVSGRYYPGLRWHAIDPGIPLSGSPNRFAHFSPRFGVAWDIFGTGKTVLRGGWGMYRWNDQYNDFTNMLSPGQGIVNYTSAGSNNVLLSQIGSIRVPAVTWSPQPVYGLSATDYNIPLTYSWNLTISHQLPGHSLLEVAYVGNNSEHILMGGGNGASTAGGGPFGGDFTNMNRTPLGALFKADPLTGVVAPNPEEVTHDLVGSLTGNTFADYHPFGVYLGTGALQGAQIYGTNLITVPTHVSYANYHAFQAGWVKESGPLTFNLNFTWSKALGTDLAINPFSLRGNYGVEAIDRPYVINTSYAYNLPNFSHGNRILNGVTNGWTIAGITNWQAGGNLQAINNANGPNFGLGLQYINYPSDLPSGNALSQRTYYGTDSGTGGANGFTIQPALACNPSQGTSGLLRANLNCFSAPAFQTAGVRNFPYLHGPVYFDSDLSVYKTFHITERQAVQFRLSAFNWLNHPLYQFSGGNQLALPFLVDYNTHAITLNTPVVQSNVCRAGLAARVNSSSSCTNYASWWGRENYKNSYPGGRILQLSVKYSF